MKVGDIRRHLQPYSIARNRKTTINHAFASALAPNDDFKDISEQLPQAIAALGGDASHQLVCFYCDEALAETWDHIHGLVKSGRYAGYGHTLGNLVPCCQRCNSRKGSKEWHRFLESAILDEGLRVDKIARLEQHIERYGGMKLDQGVIEELCPEEMDQLERTRQEILALMSRADDIAATIRAKVRSTKGCTGEAGSVSDTQAQ